MRLIDADKLEPKDVSPDAWYSPLMGFELEDIDDAPTVFELPNNPTNGDMINALFPNAKNIRVDGGYPLNYIIEGEWHRNLKEWWNAPYKGEVREIE